jgi:hypothetical protein
MQRSTDERIAMRTARLPMPHPVVPASQDRRSGTKPRLARSFSILATLAALQGLQACGNDDEQPPPPAQAVSSCVGGTFLFCEDFEALADGTATSTQWTIAQSTGASAVIEATPNANTIAKTLGQKALRLNIVEADGGGGFPFLIPNSFAAPSNNFFGRLWVWVDNKPTAPDFAHFTLVEGVGKVGAATVFVRPIGGQFIPAQFLQPGDPTVMYGAGSDGGITGDWTDWDPSAPTQEKKWTCLEWQVDTSDNIMRVFIDGVAKDALTSSTKVHNRRSGNAANAALDFVIPAVFDQFKIGWQLYQGGGNLATQDLWFDGIALSTTRIGCGD